MSRWFVMLYTHNDHPALLVVGDALGPDWSDEPAMFESEAAAEAAGRANPLGKTYGYEVYEWPA